MTSITARCLEIENAGLNQDFAVWSRDSVVCYTYLLKYCTIAIDTGPSTIELALDVSSESQCCLVHYMHLPKYCAIAIDAGPSTIELALDISSALSSALRSNFFSTSLYDSPRP